MSLLSLLSSCLRVSESQPQPTFKERVARFWGWYAANAERFYQTIEDGKSPDLADKVSKKVDEQLGSFAWVFGCGANGKGHSFTLSAEGDKHKQLLTQYWAECAPKLDGWTFYPARQPDEIHEKWAFEIHNMNFYPIEFLLTTDIDENRKLVHITAWHPLFEKMDKGQKLQMLFLTLDDLLGEYGVGQWIGKIDISADKPTQSIPIKELPALIAELEKREGWKKYPPGEEGVVYRIDKQHDAFPRGDVFVGSTMHMPLINDYLEAKGKWDNPLAEYGANFFYLTIPTSWLPSGNEAGARGKIEDAIDAALRAEKSGRVLGGATGTKNAYIDLLLLDGTRSRELVMRVVKEQSLPKETALLPFTTGTITKTAK